MSKRARKQTPQSSLGGERLTGRQLVAPPRRNRVLLGTSVVLFVVWVVSLAWLALQSLHA